MSGRLLLVFSFLLILTACPQPGNEPVHFSEVVEPPCKGPAVEIACTMHYDPVCGCDGKTYSNSCMARAAGILKTEQGPCPEDPEPVRDDLR